MTIQEATDLAVRHLQSGRLAEAEDLYRKILAVEPRHVLALHQLGVIALQRGQDDGAVNYLGQAIALAPGVPEMHSNLGEAYRGQGRWDKAIEAYRHSIELNPNLSEVHCNLAIVLEADGRPNEAMAAYRHAIALQPSSAIAHCNYGAALKNRGQPDDAIAAYRNAIALQPHLVAAHNNLGAVLMEVGRLDEAIAAFRRAISFQPNSPESWSNLLYALHFHAGYDARSIRIELDHWNLRCAEPLRRLTLPHVNERSPERRLRIGYVSPDFCDHVVGRNVLPVVERHDRARFEVFLYSNRIGSDVLTPRFKQAADTWREIARIPDQAVAELIRGDRIDILIDLSLHMAGNRLLVFARKPAPIQATWAGYPGSTGLTSIDYRLTDPYLDPPGSSNEDYSEEPIRLPYSFWCYDPLGASPQISPLPALASGFVTFGSLGNYRKINPGIIELWSEVLGAVEGSRLLLRGTPGLHRQQTLEVFQRCGVAASRIEWIAPAPREQYLAAYHRIDLGLDTLPYHGHTTSLDSFWMGVPVITLAGKTVVGRAGLSQAMNLGLPELIAETPEQFVKVARDFAANLPGLSKLRQSLRPRMQSSPLMNADEFARSLETAYRTMWQRWCTNEPSLS